MNWNDLKLFLSLVRAGNVRRAGRQAGVSHSTMARRMEQFEQAMGVKLLERQPAGYLLTEAGQAILAAAEQVEAEIDGVQRRVLGQDRQLAGRIVLTTLDVVATYLVLPRLAAFCERYPDIDVQIDVSYESTDLRRRDADIALRVTADPPDYLIGRKVGEMAHAGYATEAYLAQHDLAEPGGACWVGFGSSERHPRWVRRGPLPHLPARGTFDSMLLQVQAVRHGLGLGYLPCFVGDAEPDFVRVCEPSGFPRYDLWLLRHADTRQTARLHVFADYLARELEALAPRLEGERAPPDAPASADRHATARLGRAEHLPE